MREEKTSPAWCTASLSISGGNQQICLAVKERSYCENIREDSFKTSETHRIERVGFFFLFFHLSSLPLYCYRSFSTFERGGMSERFQSSGKTFFFFFTFYQKCLFKSLCWSPIYLVEYGTKSKSETSSYVIINLYNLKSERLLNNAWIFALYEESSILNLWCSHLSYGSLWSCYCKPSERVQFEIM